LYRNWIVGDTPNMADRWSEDRWFGYRFLNGANSVALVRCDSLPEKFPVTNDDVKSSLDRGKNLEQEMKVTVNQKKCLLINNNWKRSTWYDIKNCYSLHDVIVFSLAKTCR
jgi:hypothetical protein